MSLLGSTSIFDGRAAEHARGKLLDVAGRDAQFFGEEALAGFGDDQVNFFDARVGFEEFECFLREDGAAGPGHTYGYDLFFVVGHVQFCNLRVHSVSQRGSGKSRFRPSFERMFHRGDGIL